MKADEGSHFERSIRLLALLFEIRVNGERLLADDLGLSMRIVECQKTTTPLNR